MPFFRNCGGTSFLPLVATLYLSNKSHVSVVVWGSGDATMELGVNVACVTHASLTRVMVCGHQILDGTGDALWDDSQRGEERGRCFSK
jgi:hypothetical protein